GLGDDPRLAHAAGQQGLADRVVDLVRAGVVQVLALEEDPRAADFLAQPAGVVDRARTADVMGEVLLEGPDEAWVAAGLVIGPGQVVMLCGQCFCDDAAPKADEVVCDFGPGVVVDSIVHFGCGRRRKLGRNPPLSQAQSGTWQSTRRTSSTIRRMSSPS